MVKCRRWIQGRLVSASKRGHIMTNRLKPLLAFYNLNRTSINKIASERIEASGEYERMCKQFDGPEFVRKWRTAEMRIVPAQRAAHIIGHHVLCTQKEILQPTVTLLNAPFIKKAQSEPYPSRHRCGLIRELPEALLNRLQPVFSQSALFDPAQKFKNQFEAWQKSLVLQLDQAKQGIKGGKVYQTRPFDAYQSILDATHPVIKAWFDELIALLAEAGHTEFACGSK